MKASEFRRNFRRLKNAWIPRQSKTKAGRGPNATETKYLREIVNPGYNDGRHLISYEPAPIVITRTTSREYTADFLVQGADMRPTYHEVKGSYRLPTHDRARLAWEIAAEAHPEYDFVWAELTRRGWEIERWEGGGRYILVHLPSDPLRKFHVEPHDWRRHRKHKTRSSHGKN